MSIDIYKYQYNLSGKSECEEGLIEEAMHKVCQKTFCKVAKFMKFHLLPHTLLESYTYIVPNQIHPSYLKVADEEPWAR